MLKKINNIIACTMEYIQDITEDNKQIYNQEYIIRENMLHDFILKKMFISFVKKNNVNHDIANLIYSYMNFKNV